MFISDELIDFFNERRDLGGEVDRNAEIFLHYFGFLSAELPSLEETGIFFGGVTRERVRQIKKRCLDQIQEARQPIQGLQEVINILNKYNGISSKTFAIILATNGLASQSDSNAAGILRLLHELGYFQKFELFNLNLQHEMRAIYLRTKSSLIINTDTDALLELKKGMALAKELSGDFGLVSFSYLNERFDEDYLYPQIIAEMITDNPKNVCFSDNKDEIYFHLGGFKKDGFTSCLAKIFGVAERVHVTELAEAMRRPISKRQGSKATPLLPTTIIKQFIAEYPNLREEDDYVHFDGKTKPLSGIELDAAKYLREHESVKYLEFRDHLLDKKHRLDNIKATIYHSPIISVNKAYGFGYYQFTLIGQGDWKDLASPDEIEREIEDILKPADKDGNSGDKKQSKEEYNKALDDAKKTGELGEKLVNDFLEKNKAGGAILDYKWESENNPGAPFDFWLMDLAQAEVFVDAKSTKGRFESELHISYSELCKMSESNRYIIYRVYEVDETSAKLRVSENMSEFAKAILKYSEGFPCGVIIDGIVLKPANIGLWEKIVISL
jgi:hypothetical protein